MFIQFLLIVDDKTITRIGAYVYIRHFQNWIKQIESTAGNILCQQFDNKKKKEKSKCFSNSVFYFGFKCAYDISSGLFQKKNRTFFFL